jgi:phage Mu protein F like protein domain protein|nr:MAG TPA: minor capsid component [Caudoviricetes sp.]
MYALYGCELLSENSSGNTDYLIEPYLKQIYEGTYEDGQLVPEIYFHNVFSLLSAICEGFGKDIFSPDWNIKDNALLSRLQNNIFQFSGAKTYAELVELRDAVYEGGKLLPYPDFRRRALKINATYNETYLKVERAQVIAGATQASRWIDIQEGSDTHPYLEYVTADDKRVRENHRKLHGLIFPVDDVFWQQFYPPNGWGCRCSTRRRTFREYQHALEQYRGKHKTDMPGSEDAIKTAGKEVAKPFRHNVGTGSIFQKDGHPYFKANEAAKEGQLSAVKNYGMKPVKKIYEYEKRLSRYSNEIKSKEDYNIYWEMLESRYGKIGEGFTLIDKERKIRAQFDNSLKKKLLDRGREKFFDEVTEVFFRPDEIWGTLQSSSKFGKEAFDIYIKYYTDGPLIILINEEGRVDSFYKWEKELSQFEKFRSGLLKKKVT